MVLRRNRPSRPPEIERVDEARRVLSRVAPDDPSVAMLDEVEASLIEAIGDRDRLRATLAELDLERATRELKTALHARPSVTEPDTPTIAALRQRYDTIHLLRRRVVGIEERISRTLVDLDTVGASLAAAAAVGADTTDIAARLASDAAALRAAHEEVAQIERPL